MAERAERLEGLTGKSLADRYRLTRACARGSYCVVYEAEDDVLRRSVAVKVAELEQAGAYREAFVVTAGLSHPAFVAVYDVFEQDGYFYVIQELLDGHPLSDYLEEGAPVRRVVSLGLQMSRALAYAHEHNIAHGDVTPTSVLVDRNANIFLNNTSLPADWAYFEVAVAAAAMLSGEAKSSSEMLQALRGDARLRDVWSVGALMLSLLSADSLDPQGRAFRSDVPSELRDLITRALETSQSGSLLSAESLAMELEALDGSLAAAGRQRVETTPIAVRAFREAHQRSSRPSAPQPIRRLVQPLDDDLFYDPTLTDIGGPAELDTSQTRPADDALFAASLRNAAPPGHQGAAGPRSSAPATYRPGVTQKRATTYYEPEPYAAYGVDGWPDGQVVRYGTRHVMQTWVWTLIGIALFVASFLLGFLVFPQFHMF
ncbi:MAG TPA: protein kinase [Ktedonobacterales bacterium]